MIGIYKITNPEGKIYIGQSVNIKNRWACHRYNIKHKVKIWGLLYDSFLKYGIENHTFDIVELCEKKELDIKERYYQLKYKSFENGLNSVLNKDENNKVKYNKTSKTKMSFKGKIKVFSETHRKNMSKKGANNNNSKTILDLNTGVFYYTLSEASLLYGISKSHLSSMIRNIKTNTTNLIYV